MRAAEPMTRSVGAETVHLRLMATTDLHAQVLRYDYSSDVADPTGGLACLADVITQARRERVNSMLFDNGDFLQGNLLSDWAATYQPDRPSPIILAMNALGFDAAALGNHEFNYGLPYLQDCLKAAHFPCLSANILHSKGITANADTPLFTPWQIITRDVQTASGAIVTLKVGVIGLAPPQIPMWESLNLDQPIFSRDIVETARHYLPKIKATGADIIIALCHSGIRSRVWRDGMENASVPLAQLPQLDAIITGHTHQIFPGPDISASDVIDDRGLIHGTPAIMAGCHGSHLGIIDLTLQQNDGAWTSVDPSCEVRAASAADTGPSTVRVEIETITRPVHDQVLAHMRRQIGHTSVALSTHFAQVGPSAALTLVADAMRWAARLALIETSQATLPCLAAIAPCKAGGNNGALHYVGVEPGPLRHRHAGELYPFPNALCMLEISGADVASWLETSAQAFHRITPGEDTQPLINADVPSYGFDVIHGLTYQIDPSRPLGQRVSDIRHADGHPLGATERVVIATNAYRAGGGGGYHQAVAQARVIPITLKPLRQIIVDYISASDALTPDEGLVWRFPRLPDTRAQFHSGPAKTLPDGLRVPEGIMATDVFLDGFQSYEIDFGTADDTC